MSRIKYKEEARKLLFKYAEAAKKMIDSRYVTTGQSVLSDDITGHWGVERALTFEL